VVREVSLEAQKDRMNKVLLAEAALQGGTAAGGAAAGGAAGDVTPRSEVRAAGTSSVSACLRPLTRALTLNLMNVPSW
jgi:hypothetical protein